MYWKDKTPEAVYLLKVTNNEIRIPRALLKVVQSENIYDVVFGRVLIT